MERISVQDLWYSQNEDEWKSELDAYWKYIKPENLRLEKEISKINVEMIRSMSADEWFDFLLNKYFRWKYTAANRYTTTTNYLKKYKEKNRIEELDIIKNKLVKTDKRDTKKLLKTLSKIRGLGPAGASGLLALLYPNNFGTIDQFIVKSLIEIKSIPESKDVNKINRENITISQGVLLINIMKNKAEDLNKLFNTDFWTPRKIDMILWTYER